MPEVLLTWTASTVVGSSIDGYQLFRGVNSGPITLYQSLGDVLAYTDTDVSNGNNYSYYVVAVPLVGINSNPSNTVTESLVTFLWTQRFNPGGTTWIAVASDGSTAIAIEQFGNVARTTDGINWTLITNLGGQLINIGFGNGVWIICGSSSFGCNSSVWRSTDNGSSWTLIDNLPGGETLRLVTNNGASTWVVAVNISDISTDAGVSWNPMGITQSLVAPEYIFDGTNFLQAGSDGITNTLKRMDQGGNELSDSPMSELSTVPVTGFNWDGSAVFIACDGTQISRATSSFPWNGVVEFTSVSDGWQQIAFGAGRFLVVGTSGNSTDSTDGGITWSNPIASGAAFLEDACYHAAAGLFIGVGEGLYTYGP